MPPRGDKKAEKLLQAALAQAEVDAQKLFRQHEKERRNADMIDRVDLDNELFVGVLERERLAKERAAYAEIEEQIADARARVFEDHEKHSGWANVSAASWLPDPNSQAEINAFLSCWREQDYPNVFPHREKSAVKAVLKADEKGTAADRKRKVKQEYYMCEMGRQLAEKVRVELDEALVRQDYSRADTLRECLRHIYLQILAALDKVTSEMTRYLEMFAEYGSSDAPLLTFWSPPEACEDGDPGDAQKSAMKIKFGFIASPPSGKPLNGIKFETLGIVMEPASQAARFTRSLAKAPAVRCIQMQYDPLSVFCSATAGHKYYALDCILMVEIVTQTVSLSAKDAYTLREDRPELHEVRLAEGPESQVSLDDPILLSFRAPENVVIRHPRTPQMGAWDDLRQMWRPLAPPRVPSEKGEYVPDIEVRDGRIRMRTQYLAKMAIVQEKAFDIPYASWALTPIDDEQVLYVIEGRDDRGERQADREIRILVREHECRLAHTDKPELAALRDNWMSPATLLRRLAGAGYNFLLSNKDAEVADKDIDYVPGEYDDDGADSSERIKPKSAELELRAYSDLATFCTSHAFASSSHNSRLQLVRENESLALFRLSRAQRREGDRGLECDTHQDGQWFGVRYERDRCVLAAFADSDPEPDLSAMPEKCTHLNLHMLLRAESGDDAAIDQIAEYSSHLLQNAVFQLLALTRPLSWG